MIIFSAKYGSHLRNQPVGRNCCLNQILKEVLSTQFISEFTLTVREQQYHSSSDLHQATTGVDFKYYTELRLNTKDKEKIDCWLQLVPAFLISLLGCLLPPPLPALPGSWRPPPLLAPPCCWRLPLPVPPPLPAPPGCWRLPLPVPCSSCRKHTSKAKDSERLAKDVQVLLSSDSV